MAEKLFITFVGKSFLYLCIYFLFLYFLVNIIGISMKKLFLFTFLCCFLLIGSGDGIPPKCDS